MTRRSVAFGVAVAVCCSLCGSTDNLTALEMWGGRKAHPAVVNSVTAIPGDPWTLSLRGEWDVIENGPSSGRVRAGGRAATGDGVFWNKRTVRRVQVPGCLENALKDVHPEPTKGRTWFCTWDASPLLIRGYHLGEAWYRRKVRLPANWKGRRVWLKTGWTNSQGYRTSRSRVQGCRHLRLWERRGTSGACGGEACRCARQSGD